MNATADDQLLASTSVTTPPPLPGSPAAASLGDQVQAELTELRSDALDLVGKIEAEAERLLGGRAVTILKHAAELRAKL